MSFTLTGTLKDFGSGIPAGVEGYVQAGGMVSCVWTRCARHWWPVRRSRSMATT